VHLRYVGLPAETAIQWVIDRFREIGRLVDPNQIIATGDQPRRDSEALKAEGRGKPMLNIWTLFRKANRTVSSPAAEPKPRLPTWDEMDEIETRHLVEAGQRAIDRMKAEGRLPPRKK
jgi:hypothetical protein